MCLALDLILSQEFTPKCVLNVQENRCPPLPPPPPPSLKALLVTFSAAFSKANYSHKLHSLAVRQSYDDTHMCVYVQHSLAGPIRGPAKHPPTSRTDHTCIARQCQHRTPTPVSTESWADLCFTVRDHLTSPVANRIITMCVDHLI